MRLPEGNESIVSKSRRKKLRTYKLAIPVMTLIMNEQLPENNRLFLCLVKHIKPSNYGLEKKTTIRVRLICKEVSIGLDSIVPDNMLSGSLFGEH